MTNHASAGAGPASIPDPYGLCGQILDGQFRVDAVVGEGGFSVVYRGMHVGLGEPIAIKCLKLQGAQLGSAVVESFVRRFRDEGRILYRLSQGNLHIVRSIASGTTVAPSTSALVLYTVLEWLDGRSLAEELDARRAAGFTGRPIGELVKLLDSAVDAVAYAHAQGVVHRDLNPGNIFLAETREGLRAKVLDFGVAKIVSDHALELGPRAATLGSIRIFAPAYAAPEQFDTDIGKIAPWTDVYTLAVVLVELLRDRPAIDSPTLADIIERTVDPVRRPTPRALGVDIEDEVEEVFRRALARDPMHRPRDAGEFWGSLKNALRRSSRLSAERSVQQPRPAPSPPPAAPVAAPALAAADPTPAVHDSGPPTDRMTNEPQAADASTGRGPSVQKTLPLHLDPRYVALVRAQDPAARASNAPAPASTSSASTDAVGEDPGPSRTSGVLAVVIGAGAAVLVLIAVGAFLLLRRGHAAAPIEPAPSVSASAAAPAELPASATPPAASVAIAPSPTETAPATATAPATVEPPAATATPTAATPKPAASAHVDAGPIDPNAFDPRKADAALHVMDAVLASCPRAEGKAAEGTAHVTFASDGTVGDVVIAPPWSGTPQGDCVQKRYKAAKTTPFTGPASPVDHAFRIPK